MGGAQAVRWPHPTLPTGPVARVPVGRHDPSPDQTRLDSDLARIRLDRATVVHDRADGVGAELAGRLAALAGPGVRTVGLGKDDLVTALQWRTPGAGVLTVRPAFVDPGLQLADLFGRFAWLAGAGPDDPRVVPLAASRPWLVARTGLGGLALHGDGTLDLAGLGPAAGEAVP
jgi:hypothetical protein